MCLCLCLHIFVVFVCLFFVYCLIVFVRVWFSVHVCALYILILQYFKNNFIRTRAADFPKIKISLSLVLFKIRLFLPKILRTKEQLSLIFIRKLRWIDGNNINEESKAFVQGWPEVAGERGCLEETEVQGRSSRGRHRPPLRLRPPGAEAEEESSWDFKYVI